MRVRMITRYAGPGGVWQPGAVVDLGAAEADTLIASGYAEAEAEVKAKVKAEAEVETAEAPAAPEKAVSRRGRAKKGSGR